MISKYKCLICVNCKAVVNIYEKDYDEICKTKEDGWSNSQLLNGLIPCCQAPRIFFSRDDNTSVDNEYNEPESRTTVELEGITQVRVDRTDFIVGYEE